MERLGVPTKTAFGVGQIAEGVKNTAFSLLLLFYYVQVLGLPGSRAGLALFLALCFDAVTDPVTGSLSDRLRHRWGRRHPFMYASAVPLGASFALLFRPPDGLGEWGLFGWLLGFTVLVRASMTLFHVPHLALGAELTTDYTERTTVVAYRTVFGLVGAGLVYGISRLVVFAPSPAFPDGQLDPTGYAPFGLIFGAVMAATILVSAAGTHARIPHLPRPADDLPPFGARQIAGDYRRALANPSFRGLFIGLVFFFVMRGVQEVLNVHMATYFWRLDANQILAVLVAAVPGLVLGAPIWTAIARRLDKRPTFLVGVGLFSTCILAPPIAKIAGWYPPPESGAYVGLLVAATALAGFSAAAGLVTAGSMMADIADEHELATGRRQEGVFFGALAFSYKSSSGLGTFLAGVGLDAIAFPVQADPATVPLETVTALGILYGPGIGILAAVAIAFLAGYRIDRVRHAEIARRLAERRAA